MGNSYAHKVNPFTNKPLGAKNNTQIRELKYSEKQIGEKYGEHRDLSLEGYRTPNEYLQLAKDIYNNPEATKMIYSPDAARYAGETHFYMKNGNLLRLDSNGNFRSLYNIHIQTPKR
ncbi:hypothetical protein LJC00_00820 [Dysgonomonas sp. OttesenSCG-928-M03]|nr:hypothetical protein [Dysgonomonas sp. OttesenSCG-928-M03]